MSQMTQMIVDHKRDPQTFAIIGAAMEVHTLLGPGFLEAVYHEALSAEFRLREIPFEREVPMSVAHKGIALNCPYRADFTCFGEVLVEIKALQRVGPGERAQIINYLRAANRQRDCS